VKALDLALDGADYRARLVDEPDPVAAAGEVLVRVAASGVNRADLSQAAGHYPPPAGEPAIPGLEISGTVVGSGEGVCALLAGGGHAELAAVPQGQLMPVPRVVPLLEAAAIPEAFLTAFLNLSLEAGLRSGDSALIHAGASGVGLAAIGVARALGARVAATTRTREKLPALEAAGADLAVDSRAEDFAQVIERRWGARSVDVVLDPVGASTLAGDLRVLATGGRIVFLATMGGSKAELDIRELMSRRARLVGSTLRSRSRAEKASIVSAFRRDFLPRFDTGELRVTVDSTFPAAEAAQAFARVSANLNVGKVLIRWS
jgi:putative PIG3 family NAD(P)H quinone oxidoreductase